MNRPAIYRTGTSLQGKNVRRRQPARARYLVPLILFIVLAVLFLTNIPAERSGETDLKPAATRGHRPQKQETAFWESAVVPEGYDRLPAPTIRPEDLGIKVPATPPDPQALISQAIAENDQAAIQAAALAWFQQDPAAARDWLSSQATLDDLQPAIRYIANHLSETGDVHTAMEWAATLSDATAREDTLFDIQALALRSRRITVAEITSDGLSEERTRQLMSGAAGD